MQGTYHLSYLLGHLCATDNVGRLLLITMDTLQLHLGFPQPPFTYPYSLIEQYVETSWVTTTWMFLHGLQGKVALIGLWVLPLDRVDDNILMPAVFALLNTPILSKADILKFNRCQLYLQVLTLSDLVDNSGRSITSDA